MIHSINLKSILLFIYFIYKTACAFENSMLDITIPSQLNKHDMVFAVLHKFYGSPQDYALGTTVGTNIGLSFKYKAWNFLELGTFYQYDKREFNIGPALLFNKWKLQTRFDAQWFTYKENINGSYINGLSLLASIQSSELLFKRFSPALNIETDTYNRNIGFGTGLFFEITPALDFFGEYFPPIMETQGNGIFSLGIKLNTYGHHFKFFMGNSTQMGIRRIIQDKNNKEMHIGFAIERLFIP